MLVDKTKRKVLQVFCLEVERSRSIKREIVFQMRGKKLAQLVAGAMLPPPDEVFLLKYLCSSGPESSVPLRQDTSGSKLCKAARLKYPKTKPSKGSGKQPAAVPSFGTPLQSCDKPPCKSSASDFRIQIHSQVPDWESQMFSSCGFQIFQSSLTGRSPTQ